MGGIDIGPHFVKMWPWTVAGEVLVLRAKEMIISPRIESSEK